MEKNQVIKIPINNSEYLITSEKEYDLIKKEKLENDIEVLKGRNNVFYYKNNQLFSNNIFHYENIKNIYFDLETTGFINEKIKEGKVEFQEKKIFTKKQNHLTYTLYDNGYMTIYNQDTNKTNSFISPDIVSIGYILQESYIPDYHYNEKDKILTVINQDEILQFEIENILINKINHKIEYFTIKKNDKIEKYIIDKKGLLFHIKQSQNSKKIKEELVFNYLAHSKTIEEKNLFFQLSGKKNIEPGSVSITRLIDYEQLKEELKTLDDVKEWIEICENSINKGKKENFKSKSKDKNDYLKEYIDYGKENLNFRDLKEIESKDYEIQTNEVAKKGNKYFDDFLTKIKESDFIYGHNVASFDMQILTLHDPDVLIKNNKYVENIKDTMLWYMQYRGLKERKNLNTAIKQELKDAIKRKRISEDLGKEIETLQSSREEIHDSLIDIKVTAYLAMLQSIQAVEVGGFDRNFSQNIYVLDEKKETNKLKDIPLIGLDNFNNPLLNNENIYKDIKEKNYSSVGFTSHILENFEKNRKNLKENDLKDLMIFKLKITETNDEIMIVLNDIQDYELLNLFVQLKEFKYLNLKDLEILLKNKQNSMQFLITPQMDRKKEFDFLKNNEKVFVRVDPYIDFEYTQENQFENNRILTVSPLIDDNNINKLIASEQILKARELETFKGENDLGKFLNFYDNIVIGIPDLDSLNQIYPYQSMSDIYDNAKMIAQNNKSFDFYRDIGRKEFPDFEILYDVKIPELTEEEKKENNQEIENSKNNDLYKDLKEEELINLITFKNRYKKMINELISEKLNSNENKNVMLFYIFQQNYYSQITEDIYNLNEIDINNFFQKVRDFLENKISEIDIEIYLNEKKQNNLLSFLKENKELLNQQLKTEMQEDLDLLQEEFQVYENLSAGKNLTNFYYQYFLQNHLNIKKSLEPEGVIVGPGRGSVGSSIISYYLDISKVHPKKMKTFLPRFVHEEKGDKPDIDIDHHLKNMAVKIYNQKMKDKFLINEMKEYKEKFQLIDDEIEYILKEKNISYLKKILAIVYHSRKTLFKNLAKSVGINAQAAQRITPSDAAAEKYSLLELIYQIEDPILKERMLKSVGEENLKIIDQYVNPKNENIIASISEHASGVLNTNKIVHHNETTMNSIMKAGEEGYMPEKLDILGLNTLDELLQYKILRSVRQIDEEYQLEIYDYFMDNIIENYDTSKSFYNNIEPFLKEALIYKYLDTTIAEWNDNISIHENLMNYKNIKDIKENDFSKDNINSYFEKNSFNYDFNHYRNTHILNILMKGETAGLFQLDKNTPAQLSKQMLSLYKIGFENQIKPFTELHILDILTMINALNRPGPLGAGMDKEIVLNMKKYLVEGLNELNLLDDYEDDFIIKNEIKTFKKEGELPEFVDTTSFENFWKKNIEDAKLKIKNTDENVLNQLVDDYINQTGWITNSKFDYIKLLLKDNNNKQEIYDLLKDLKDVIFLELLEEKKREYDDLLTEMLRDGKNEQEILNELKKYHLNMQNNPEVQKLTLNSMGTTLFQEQIMVISQKFAGFSNAGSDVLRKAISKKKNIDIALKDFVDNAIKEGIIDKNTARYMAVIFEAFGAYAFNISHSGAYSMISYSTAEAKVADEGLFYTVMLNKEKQENLSPVLKELKLKEYTFKLKDINEPLLNFKIGKNKEIYVPLTIYKGLKENCIHKIIEERKKAPFETIYEVIIRLHPDITKSDFEILVQSGSLNELIEKDGLIQKNVHENASTIFQTVRDLLKNVYENENKFLINEDKILKIQEQIEIFLKDLQKKDKYKDLTLEEIKEKENEHPTMVKYKEQMMKLENLNQKLSDFNQQFYTSKGNIQTILVLKLKIDKLKELKKLNTLKRKYEGDEEEVDNYNDVSDKIAFIRKQLTIIENNDLNNSLLYQKHNISFSKDLENKIKNSEIFQNFISFDLNEENIESIIEQLETLEENKINNVKTNLNENQLETFEYMSVSEIQNLQNLLKDYQIFLSEKDIDDEEEELEPIETALLDFLNQKIDYNDNIKFALIDNILSNFKENNLQIDFHSLKPINHKELIEKSQNLIFKNETIALKDYYEKKKDVKLIDDGSPIHIGEHAKILVLLDYLPNFPLDMNELGICSGTKKADLKIDKALDIDGFYLNEENRNGWYIKDPEQNDKPFYFKVEFDETVFQETDLIKNKIIENLNSLDSETVIQNLIDIILNTQHYEILKEKEILILINDIKKKNQEIEEDTKIKDKTKTLEDFIISSFQSNIVNQFDLNLKDSCYIGKGKVMLKPDKKSAPINMSKYVETIKIDKNSYIKYINLILERSNLNLNDVAIVSLMPYSKNQLEMWKKEGKDIYEGDFIQRYEQLISTSEFSIQHMLSGNIDNTLKKINRNKSNPLNKQKMNTNELFVLNNISQFKTSNGIHNGFITEGIGNPSIQWGYKTDFSEELVERANNIVAILRDSIKFNLLTTDINKIHEEEKKLKQEIEYLENIKKEFDVMLETEKEREDFKEVYPNLFSKEAIEIYEDFNRVKLKTLIEKIENKTQMLEEEILPLLSNREENEIEEKLIIEEKQHNHLKLDIEDYQLIMKKTLNNIKLYQEKFNKKSLTTLEKTLNCIPLFLLSKEYIKDNKELEELRNNFFNELLDIVKKDYSLSQDKIKEILLNNLKIRNEQTEIFFQDKELSKIYDLYFIIDLYRVNYFNQIINDRYQLPINNLIENLNIIDKEEIENIYNIEDVDTCVKKHLDQKNNQMSR